MNVSTKTVRPTTKAELRFVIKQELERQGWDADLNHIDTSLITDMSNLFWLLSPRSIKIDKWDVSNVTLGESSMSWYNYLLDKRDFILIEEHDV